MSEVAAEELKDVVEVCTIASLIRALLFYLVFTRPSFMQALIAPTIQNPHASVPGAYRADARRLSPLAGG